MFTTTNEREIRRLQNILTIRKKDYETFGCTEEDKIKDIEIEAEIRNLSKNKFTE